MANRKVTDLPEKTVLNANDIVYLVDSEDTTESPQGTSKKTKVSALATMASGVQSVTGSVVDNTDPLNPVVNAASEAYANTRADQARDEANNYTDTIAAVKQNTLVSGTNIKTVNGTTLLGSGNLQVPRTFAVALNRAITITNPTWYVTASIISLSINTDSTTSDLVTALSAAVYGNQVCGAPYNCKLTHIVYTGRGASATIFGVVKGTISSTGTLTSASVVFEGSSFQSTRNRVITVSPSVTINAGEVIRFSQRQDNTSAASDQATITFFFEEVI